MVCSNPFNTNFSCRKRNVTYKTYCLKCAEEAGANEKTLKDNVNSSIKFYFGETSRDAYTRGAEHLSDYIGQTDDSHMYKHLSDSHQDSRPRDVKFGMSVIKQHRSSFERMIFESCLIFRNENNVLNSKSEFNRCQVPRLSVMIGDNSNVAHPSNEKGGSVPCQDLNVKKRKTDCFNLLPSKKKRKVDHNDKVKMVQRLNDIAVLGLDSNDAKKVKFSHLSTTNSKLEVLPKPTKKKPKIKSNGQTKISNFFPNTQTKPVLQNSPSPAPT